MTTIVSLLRKLQGAMINFKIQILMNEVATEEAQWTMNELQTQLERPNSRYQEMYKGFQMWTIE